MMLRRLFDEKFWKFILVGIVNTLAGMAIMFGLYNLAHCSYWVSSAANYIICSVMSYFLNKNFTFKSREKVSRSAWRFAVNIAVCYLIAYGAAKPAVRFLLSGAEKTVQENIAMLAGMCIFVGLNYLGQRFFAFRSAPDKN